MTAVEIAQRYFDAWNRRDPEAISATFASDGTYQDPATGGPLTGSAIGQYASGLFAAFPDLSFEVVSAAPAGDGVAAQWMMRGTNRGSIGGAPATGRSVALPGADFLAIEGDRIRSVTGYFDQRTFVEQLGLQVLVQPHALGPATFGGSTRVQPGNRTKPGAFSLTWIEVRSDEEADEVSTRSRQIVREMVSMPGFIGMMSTRIGHRLSTITAWEDPESARRLLRDGAHKEAMDRFFGPEFAISAMTSVWVPERINGVWIRCTSCGRMCPAEKLRGTCHCGVALPDPPPYW